MKQNQIWKKFKLIVTDYFSAIPETISIKNYRFYLVAHVAYNFAFCVHLLWLFLFLVIGVTQLFIFNIFSVILFTACIFINRKGHHMLTTVVGMSEVVAHQIFASYLLGSKSGYPLYILVVSLYPFIMPAWRGWIKIMLFIMSLLSFLAIEIFIKNNPPAFQINDTLLNALNISNIFFAFVCLSIWGTYFNFAVYKTEKQLEEEFAKSEQLTRTISSLEKMRLIEEIKQQESDLRNEFKDNLHDDLNSEIMAIKGNSEFIAMKGSELQKEVIINRTMKITEACEKILLNTAILIRENSAKADAADELFEDMLNHIEFSLPGITIEKRNIPQQKTNRSIPLLIRKNYFFIFKECITNIKKHSKCNKVVVAWGLKVNTLFLEIEDNGIGFDPTVNSNGNGLDSFKKRAEKINGIFNVNSSAGNGTKITLEVLIT